MPANHFPDAGEKRVRDADMQIFDDLHVVTGHDDASVT